MFNFFTSSGTLWIVLAAILWATDSVVRYPLSFDQEMNPVLLVYLEHVFGLIGLFPFVIFFYKKKIFQLSLKDWGAVLFCGLVSSAIGTIFFTMSMQFINPSVSLLLQKLQPIFVTVIAYFFLGERPSKKFYLLAPIAIFSGFILSISDFSFSFKGTNQNNPKGIGLSLLAAFIWATATVVGKKTLKNYSPLLVTFWRFFFASFGLGIFLFFRSVPIQYDSSQIISLLYLSFFPGVFAIILYYQGLQQTSATIATIVELIYPVCAIVLNTLFLQTPLKMYQIIGAFFLLLSIGCISWEKKKPHDFS